MPRFKKKIPTLVTDPDEEEHSLPTAENEEGVEVQINPNIQEEEDATKEDEDPVEEERLRIWDLFAEEYHDIVAELPLEYQRNFTLLQQLEETQQTSVLSIKSTLEAYIASLSAATASSSPRVSASEPASESDTDPVEIPSKLSRTTLAALGKATRGAIRAGEDKVGLAVMLYEAVDRHIRRLDSDLAKYEDSLVIGLRAGTLPSHDAPSLSLKSPPGPTTSRGAIALGEREAYISGDGSESPGKRRGRGPGPLEDKDWKKRRDEKKRERKEKEEKERDMPIDPHEPLYCYCHRPSFGEMMGCENDDCEREWFHLECLGLEVAPLDKWWCKECIEKLGIGQKIPLKKQPGKKGR